MYAKDSFLFNLSYSKKSETWLFDIDNYEPNMIQEKPYGSLLFEFLDFDISKIYEIIDQIQNLDKKETHFDEDKVLWPTSRKQCAEDVQNDKLAKLESDVKLLPDIFTAIKKNVRWLVAPLVFSNHAHFESVKKETLVLAKEIVQAHESMNIMIKEDLFGETFASDENKNRIEKIISILQKSDVISRLTDGKEIIGNLITEIVPYKDNENYTIGTFFITTNFYNILRAYVVNFLQNNVFLKNCKNCGKPFISQNNSIYCDRIFDSKGRTCKQVGALKQHKINVKSNLAVKEYKKAYAKYYARLRKLTITNDEFRKWRQNANDMNEKYRNGIINIDELINWLQK